jgi:hypothetical protein
LPATVAGGLHWRLTTARGPVHVWRPSAYRAQSGGIVLYLHGYNIRVDQAWDTFKLAEQFRASQQNAIFVVPEAPTSTGEDLPWPDLGSLLRAVAHGTRLRLPRGHVVALGHSGAFRTLAAWLQHKWLDHVILLDALYAHEAIFEHWLASDPKREQHKMVIVASDTRANSEAFVGRFRFAARRKQVPEAFTDLTSRERHARLLYFMSQYRHNEMISNGKVIPLVLRTTRLRRL